MLASQALCASRMKEARENDGLSRELRGFLQSEYGVDAVFVAARLGRADGVRRGKTGTGVARGALRALAKLPEALAAAFTTPGGT